ncbi:Ras gene family, member Gd [Balamuthia mandrillaris]
MNNNKRQGNVGAASLSHEVLLLLFSFLESPRDLCACSLVCTLWHDPAVDDMLWKSLFLARWPTGDSTKQTKRWKQKFKRQHLIDAKQNETMGDVETVWKHLLESRNRNSSARTDVTLKVTLVGDIGVGKTCLAITIADGGAFPEEYIPSVFYEWVCSMDLSADLTVHFSLHDTMGDDLSSSASSSPSSYARHRALGYPGTDVYLLCFAVDEPQVVEKSRGDLLAGSAERLSRCSCSVGWAEGRRQRRRPRKRCNKNSNVEGSKGSGQENECRRVLL